MHFHRLLVSLVAAWVVGAAPMPDVDVDAQLDKRATPGPTESSIVVETSEEQC